MTPWLVREPPPRQTAPAHQATVEELLDTGGIILDKPAGPTSHQVSAWVRDLIGVDKAGHAGTLDPNVTGVLPVLLGRGTRALEGIKGGDKAYVGVLRLRDGPPATRVRDAFGLFHGPVYQLPPKEAAVKRELRVRTIHALEILEAEPAENPRRVLFRIECEAGFYVRKLAEDLGCVLGTGATLQDLRRVRAGPFPESEAVDLHEVKDALDHWRETGEESWIRRIVQPLESMLAYVPRIELKDSAVGPVCHGSPLMAPGVVRVDEAVAADRPCLLVTRAGEAVALGRALLDAAGIATAQKGPVARPDRVLREPPSP